jgi:hypothetical protein
VPDDGPHLLFTPPVFRAIFHYLDPARAPNHTLHAHVGLDPDATKYCAGVQTAALAIQSGAEPICRQLFGPAVRA